MLHWAKLSRRWTGDLLRYYVNMDCQLIKQKLQNQNVIKSKRKSFFDRDEKCPFHFQFFNCSRFFLLRNQKKTFRPCKFPLDWRTEFLVFKLDQLKNERGFWAVVWQNEDIYLPLMDSAMPRRRKTEIIFIFCSFQSHSSRATRGCLVNLSGRKHTLDN